MKWLSLITVAAAMIAVGILPASAGAKSSAAKPAAQQQMCNVDPDTGDCYENEPCWYAQDGNDPDCPMNDDYGFASASDNGSSEYQGASGCYDFDNVRHGSWSWWNFDYGFTACVSNGSVTLSNIHSNGWAQLPWYLRYVYGLDYTVTDQWTAGGNGADWAEGYIAYHFRFCSAHVCAAAGDIWIAIYVDAYGVNDCYTDRRLTYNCTSS
jgi:hypothetical protein